MRGKLRNSKQCGSKFRITPAGAGKTEPATVCVSFFQDHPRRCGENAGGLSRIESLTGSPPQVRGKPIPSMPSGMDSRITPAGAGKTTPRDYDQKIQIGSPPQVRGKRDEIVCPVTDNGITPAGAGKTRVRHYDFAASWDHPRRCGENRVRLEEHLCGLGSPPQVRGKHFLSPRHRRLRRITPAGAGKT